jgi:hypothetical protein
MLTRSRDQRKSARHFTRRAATVCFGSRTPSVSCVIWDISDGGARLAVSVPMADLPQQFTLNIFADGSVQRNCEVVWTDERFVGVKFTGPRP